MKLSIEPLNIEGVDNTTVQARLSNILMSWQGTRYLPGCQAKGVGVDCVRFVSGVLDELYGTHTELDRLPQDASFHAKDKCYSALKTFMGNYKYEEVTDGVLQPGDVVIAGPRGGGPGHALIAGIDCLWHCDSRSVTRTGLSFTTGGVYFFKKAIRAKDRERWALCL